MWCLKKKTFNCLFFFFFYLAVNFNCDWHQTAESFFLEELFASSQIAASCYKVSSTYCYSAYKGGMGGLIY